MREDVLSCGWVSEWEGCGNVTLLTRLNAWEVLGGAREGWELLDQSMESSQRHRGGTGEVMTRVGYCQSHVGG